MELEIPDFDVKINFNPNDDDESLFFPLLSSKNAKILTFEQKFNIIKKLHSLTVNDYLRIHPEAGQYVASTQAFLHELLGAISYQLNEALSSIFNFSIVKQTFFLNFWLFLFV